jgi:hypothetical protein
MGRMKINDNEACLIKEYLSKFDSISVRDLTTSRIIENILGKKPKIVIDPTMLLSIDEWNKNIGKNPIVDSKYIFLYDASYEKEVSTIANKLSKILKLRIVTSTFNTRNDILYSSWKKIYSAGPWEFLNLLKNACLVIGHSFHCTIFSILFHKPFFAVNGMNDPRISDLLSKMDLQERNIDIESMEKKSEYAFDCDFSSVDNIISAEQIKSLSFLQAALS